MTLREKVEALIEDTKAVYRDSHSRDERRIDELCLLVERRARLVEEIATEKP